MNTEVKGVLYISQVSCPSLPISSLKQQSCLLVWATPWRFWFLHSELEVYLSHSSWLQPHHPVTAHSLCALLAFQLWGLPRGLTDCKTPDLQARSQLRSFAEVQGPMQSEDLFLQSDTQCWLWGAEDTSRQAAVSAETTWGHIPFIWLPGTARCSRVVKTKYSMKKAQNYVKRMSTLMLHNSVKVSLPRSLERQHLMWNQTTSLGQSQ